MTRYSTTKPTGHEANKKSNSKAELVRPLAMPMQTGRPALQRKACSCGGGCPRCQAESNEFEVSNAGDSAEIEADQIADKIMHAPVANATSHELQNNDASGSPASAENDELEPLPAMLSRKENMVSSSPVPPDDGASSIGNVLNSSGSPLDDGTRRFFEPRLGMNLENVRVHTDWMAAQSARNINAKAYTHANHIAFDSGEYRPDSNAGRHLIAHELAHVLQQNQTSDKLVSRQDRDVAEAVEPAIGTGVPARGQMFVGQTPDGLWFYTFNSDDYVTWIDHIEHFVIIHLNNAFIGMTEAVIREYLAQEHHFTIENESGASSGYPPNVRVGLSFEMGFHNGLVSWMSTHHPEIRARELFTGIQDLPPVPAGLGGTSSDAESPGPAASVDSTLPTTDRHITPTRADLTALTGNPGLSLLYLLMMQHFSSLHLNDENRALASDGLTAEELEGLIGDDILRRTLTTFFTQGWVEFVNAGGNNPDAFGSLIERILEQYTRGNPNATANRLRIGHGIPEQEILGIVHRNNGILMYDDLGQPLRWNLAPRDHGYMGVAVSESAVREGMASDEAPMTHREEMDMLTLNLFLQATGAQDIAMVEQAAVITMQHIRTVSSRIREGLPGDIAAALAETIGVLTGFLVGHAFTAFAMRSPSPHLFGLGLAVEILLRGAGYVMGIRFLSDVQEILLEAGFHMSRVRDDEEGNPTALSEYHMNMAAEPIRQLLIDTAVFMGGIAFAGAVRNATVRGAVLRWMRVAGTGFMLGIADAVPATRGTGGGPGPLGGRSPTVEAPALIDSPLIPESEVFIDPARTAEAPRTVEAAPTAETTAASPAPIVENAPPVETTAISPAPIIESAPTVETRATSPAPIVESAPPVETRATSPAPIVENAPPVETTASSPTPATETTAPASEAAMQSALIDAYLQDPAGIARRRARLAELSRLIQLLRSDRGALREHRSTSSGRAALRSVVEEYRRLQQELAALPPETAVTEAAPETAVEVEADSSPASTAPETSASETAQTTETAVEPVSPARTPRVLSPTERVSVNPGGTIYYPEGTRFFGHAEPGWTESTVAEAEARGARRTAMPESRVTAPSGVYSVERPALGDRRIVLRAWLGFREARAGLERHMMSAGEYALEILRGWQRAHASGAGLGAESGEAIRLAPEFVNQILQNRGIEQFLRDLRSEVIPEGGRVHVTTVVETHPMTFRLAAIEYQIEVVTENGLSPLGSVRIEVSPEGNSQGFVRAPGGDVYEPTPIFDTSGEPVR